MHKRVPFYSDSGQGMDYFLRFYMKNKQHFILKLKTTSYNILNNCILFSVFPNTFHCFTFMVGDT